MTTLINEEEEEEITSRRRNYIKKKKLHHSSHIRLIRRPLKNKGWNLWSREKKTNKKTLFSQ
jgi:hypothetical protein